jgi:hypothetical protein
VYSTYAVTLHELKAVLKVSTPAGQTNSAKATGQKTTHEDGSKEVRKQRTTYETALNLPPQGDRHPKRLRPL